MAEVKESNYSEGMYESWDFEEEEVEPDPKTNDYDNGTETGSKDGENFDIRIRNEAELFEKYFDEEYDEEAEMDYYDQQNEIKKTSRKQHLSTIERDDTSPIFGDTEEFDEIDEFLQDSGESIQNLLRKNGNKTPLYLLNPNDFQKDPGKRAQIRRAVVTYRHHQEKKGLLNKFKEENQKLKSAIEMYRKREQRIIANCSCKRVIDIINSSKDPRTLLTPTQVKLNLPPIPMTLNQEKLSQQKETVQNSPKAKTASGSITSVTNTNSNTNTRRLNFITQQQQAHFSKYKPIAPKPKPQPQVAPMIILQNHSYNYNTTPQLYNNTTSNYSQVVGETSHFGQQQQRQKQPKKSSPSYSVTSSNLKYKTPEPPKMTKTIERIQMILSNQQRQLPNNDGRTSKTNSSASSPILLSQPDESFEIEELEIDNSSFDSDSLTWSVKDFKQQDAYDGTEFDFVKPSNVIGKNSTSVVKSQSRVSQDKRIQKKIPAASTGSLTQQQRPKNNFYISPESSKNSQTSPPENSSKPDEVQTRQKQKESPSTVQREKSKRAAAIYRKSTAEMLNGNGNSSLANFTMGRKAPNKNDARTSPLKNPPELEGYDCDIMEIDELDDYESKIQYFAQNKRRR